MHLRKQIYSSPWHYFQRSISLLYIAENFQAEKEYSLKKKHYHLIKKMTFSIV